MQTQNVSTLKIHKLTQAQYDREAAAGNIDETALYLTPDEEIDLSNYATKDEVSAKADSDHTHVISDVTDLQTQLDSKSDTSHVHTISDVTDLQTTLDDLDIKLDAIDAEVDGSIKSITASGTTITYTKNDGSTGTITTQDTNTDTKVTNTLATTTKAYVTGTTSASTNTGTQVFDTGVYLDTTAGQLVATTFKGDLTGSADFAYNAESALSATTAVSATQDANGNVITSTYETKTDANTKLETAVADATAYTDERLASVTTSGDGSAYTAVVLGITSLTAGVSFIMKPHVVSASTQPTLNVNSLGAKYIRRRLSTATGTLVAGNSTNWLTADKPVRVIYDGTFWVVDLVRPSASDIYGTIPISAGGTGASSATMALANLGLTTESWTFTLEDGSTVTKAVYVG